jgi:hypothetical protein
MPKKPSGEESGFIEPIGCLPVDKLPDGAGWLYELKIDFEVLADDLAYLLENTVTGWRAGDAFG